MDRLEGGEGQGVHHALIPVSYVAAAAAPAATAWQRPQRCESAARRRHRRSAGFWGCRVHHLALLVLDTTKESGNEDRDRCNRALFPG